MKGNRQEETTTNKKTTVILYYNLYIKIYNNNILVVRLHLTTYCVVVPIIIKKYTLFVTIFLSYIINYYHLSHNLYSYIVMYILPDGNMELELENE